MKCGLVSISFRENTPEEIIEAAAGAGLNCIEWGSDVHLRADDISRAKEIKRRTEEAGLEMPSYGTYIGLQKLDLTELKKCLKMADLMEMQTLRIWPPDDKKPDFSSEEYKEYVRSCRLVADKAKEYDKLICLECHQGVLTDDYQTTLRFIQDVNRENLKMYWQPNQFKSFEYNLKSAKELSPLVTNIHVFNWKEMDRFPMSQGEKEWKEYAEQFKQTNCQNIYMLEFMYNNSISVVKQEADSLRGILGEVYL